MEPDELLVEIWCPLADMAMDDFEEFFDEVWSYLEAEEHGLRAECFDDSETIGDHEVFAVWHGPEQELLEVARRVAALPKVPAGSYALVTTVEKQLSGEGRRVELAP